MTKIKIELLIAGTFVMVFSFGFGIVFHNLDNMFVPTLLVSAVLFWTVAQILIWEIFNRR